MFRPLNKNLKTREIFYDNIDNFNRDSRSLCGPMPISSQ